MSEEMASELFDVSQHVTLFHKTLSPSKPEKEIASSEIVRTIVPKISDG
jgi:hypothetical protein